MFPINKFVFFTLLMIGIFTFLFIDSETHFSLHNEDPGTQSQLVNEKSNPKITEVKELNDDFNNLKEQTKDEKTMKNPFKFTTPKPMALMLFGVDRTVEEKYGRSDSIMLALVQPNTMELMLLSIPRDTYIQIPDYGLDKLNTAFMIGGPELTKETVENWLNIDISDTVCIDYASFEKIIDLIGGIEINVDRRMTHSEFVLEEGLQTLSGKEALYFVRFRKSLDGNHDSDYKRTERQRLVISKLSDELLNTRSFRQSFSLFRSLIKTIDTTLPIQKIVTYGLHYSDFSSDNITATSFKGFGDQRDGIWYEIISEKEFNEKKQLINDFLEK